MELCPVCKKNRLTGRQRTCSSACRSARYRGNKKQRLTSQPGARQPGAGRDSRSRDAVSRRRVSSAKKVEQMVAHAVDKIITAIRQRESESALQSTALRLDIREQVTAQAPKQAAGYRLALPGRDAAERPKLIPARSRTRDITWYSLSPFEYPDDLRLRDGCWYRIVWIDTQGQRLRLQLGESVPGLYFFVGPAQPRPTELARDPRIEPPEASHSQQSPPPAQVDARPSVLSTFPPQLLAATTAEERAAFAAMPPLSLDNSNLLIRFVQQPEWMLQLLHRENAIAANAEGGPPPPEPPTSLSHHERKEIHDLLSARSSTPFVALVKLLHAYVRKRGHAALDFLPTPMPPLPEAERERMQAAIANKQRRMYLDYVHTRQESLLRGLPLPDEPASTLSSKERSQLRRMLRDTRAVIFLEQQIHPVLAFFES